MTQYEQELTSRNVELAISHTSEPVRCNTSIRLIC